MKQWKQDKKFLVSLSNLEKMMRDKISTDSFRTIRTYSVSKGLVHANNRKKGTEDLVNMVRSQYLKNLNMEFQKYKSKCQGGNEKSDRLKVCWTN
jgi:hypothetical protein